MLLSSILSLVFATKHDPSWHMKRSQANSSLMLSDLRDEYNTLAINEEQRKIKCNLGLKTLFSGTVFLVTNQNYNPNYLRLSDDKKSLTSHDTECGSIVPQEKIYRYPAKIVLNKEYISISASKRNIHLFTPEYVSGNPVIYIYYKNWDWDKYYISRKVFAEPCDKSSSTYCIKPFSNRN